MSEGRFFLLAPYILGIVYWECRALFIPNKSLSIQKTGVIEGESNEKNALGVFIWCHVWRFQVIASKIKKFSKRLITIERRLKTFYGIV